MDVMLSPLSESDPEEWEAYSCKLAQSRCYFTKHILKHLHQRYFYRCKNGFKTSPLHSHRIGTNEMTGRTMQNKKCITCSSKHKRKNCESSSAGEALLKFLHRKWSAAQVDVLKITASASEGPKSD